MITESPYPLEDLQRYFTIGLAMTTTDLQETFRIRYRVYCEEFGYEPREYFPTGMEVDLFDEVATHCLVTHKGSGLAAGCVRICPASISATCHSMPYEKFCGASVDQVQHSVFRAPRERMCEASRFAVDGVFRRRSGEALTRFGEARSWDLSVSERRTFPLISVGLTFGAAVMAEQLGRTYVFALMEPFLPRLLRRFGICFNRVGRDVDYHGIRAVYYIDTDEFLMTMDRDFHQLYNWIAESIRGSLQYSEIADLPLRHSRVGWRSGGDTV